MPNGAYISQISPGRHMTCFMSEKKGRAALFPLPRVKICTDSPDEDLPALLKSQPYFNHYIFL